MPANARDLNVITVHSNPVRYASRARLHLEHQARMAEAGVTLWVVEAVFGDRAPEVTDPSNPRHITVRCDSEVWLKEAMINLAAEKIPADAKYLMWQDADIRWLRSDWATETIEALQHYRVVQPFTNVIDLGPEGEVIQTHRGFAYLYEKGLKPGLKYGEFLHPGYAWAWRRSAWDAVGGMIDRAICGAADHHMACALIGLGETSVPGNVADGYKRMVSAWQALAERHVQRDIGHIPGTITHDFHGWKADRNYVSRWSILSETGFDPYTDLTKDSSGMLRLNPAKTYLRDRLRQYFRQRMEDAQRRSWPV
jgi:hypothetical protein